MFIKKRNDQHTKGPVAFVLKPVDTCWCYCIEWSGGELRSEQHKLELWKSQLGTDIQLTATAAFLCIADVGTPVAGPSWSVKLECHGKQTTTAAMTILRFLPPALAPTTFGIFFAAPAS